MSKRNRECEEESSAWEIALADLMTVLMVFFLVMWLTSIVDPAERQAFVDSIMGETEGDSIIEMSKGEPIKLEEQQQQQEQQEPLSTQEIEQALSNVNPKDITIEETENHTKITLRSDSFFESGRATIQDKIREELEKLGESLAGRDQTMTIVGYTDNIPISNFQFPSNWELSASRAATVARVFIDMDVNQELIKIEGRADNDPVAQNNTSYGRSLNRRVIILVNKKQVLPKKQRPEGEPLEYPELFKVAKPELSKP